MGEVDGIFTALLGKAQKSLYHVGLQGNRILMTLAEVVIGWLLVRQAGVATEKLAAAEGPDALFYQGKIATAKWFCANVLPSATLTRKLVEGSTLDLMELPEEAF
jgi:hypothetical protein